MNVQPSFETLVARGKIPGHSFIDKFGENLSISSGNDYQDICDGCDGLVHYSDINTADIISLSSSDDGDDQFISIEGLSITGEFVNQAVQLNGQTRVALTTPLWRVFRMEVEDSLTVTNLAGTVYCFSGTEVDVGGVPTGESIERIRINNGNNQTLFAGFTIPLGKVGQLYEGETILRYTSTPPSGGDYCTLHYRSRRVGSVFKTKKTVSVGSNASSVYQDIRTFKDPIPALTDINITKVEASDEMGIAAAFDIMLIDEELFDPNYLINALKQPFEMPTP